MAEAGQSSQRKSTSNHDVFAAFAWMGIILLVFVPFAVNKYKKVA